MVENNNAVHQIFLEILPISSRAVKDHYRTVSNKG
jgi:hypothetical protein